MIYKNYISIFERFILHVPHLFLRNLTLNRETKVRREMSVRRVSPALQGRM